MGTVLPFLWRALPKSGLVLPKANRSSWAGDKTIKKASGWQLLVLLPGAPYIVAYPLVHGRISPAPCASSEAPERTTRVAAALVSLRTLLEQNPFYFVRVFALDNTTRVGG